jgi:hypothetical protein
MKKTQKENNNPEYWTCYIGPIDRDELDETHPMGEGLIRSWVKEAFYKVAGYHADTCGSGWGCKPEYLDHMRFGNNTEEMKLALVKSYIHEGKKMPRYIRAWYLLLKEEGKID